MGVLFFWVWGGGCFSWRGEGLLFLEGVREVLFFIGEKEGERGRRRGCFSGRTEGSLKGEGCWFFFGTELHADGAAGRGLTATKQYPLELAAPLKAIRCYVRKSDGISVDALETGTGPHVDENGVDAS